EHLVLLTLSSNAIARDVVPVAFQRVLNGEAGVQILVRLLRRRGDPVEIVRAGASASRVGIPNGEAHGSRRGDAIAEVRNARARVVFIHGQRVRCIEARVSAQIVDPLVRAAYAAFILVAVEVASASRIGQYRLEVTAARSAERD